MRQARRVSRTYGRSEGAPGLRSRRFVGPAVRGSRSSGSCRRRRKTSGRYATAQNVAPILGTGRRPAEAARVSKGGPSLGCLRLGGLARLPGRSASLIGAGKSRLVGRAGRTAAVFSAARSCRPGPACRPSIGVRPSGRVLSRSRGRGTSGRTERRRQSSRLALSRRAYGAKTATARRGRGCLAPGGSGRPSERRLRTSRSI